MSLTPYYGEFLVSPVPLHLELNYCSHNCPYCFANLNNPKRRTDMTQTVNLLKDFQNRETLVAKLLQERYPVLLSNLVDPFAASNYKQTLPFLETLTGLGIPVAFQTRGGYGVDEALGIIAPSVWYISIPYWDDNIRQRIEPAAPSIQSRFALIEKLKALGHEVVVGVNPLVEEWLPNPKPLLEYIKSLGVHGIWLSQLHFNRDQLKVMPEKSKLAMGQDAIQQAYNRTYKRSQLDVSFLLQTQFMAHELGLETFIGGQGQPTNFFEPYRKLYPKTFPVLTDFINLVVESGERVFSIEDWFDVTLQDLPNGAFGGSGSYIGSRGRTLYKSMKIPARLSYRQILTLAWSEPKYPTSVLSAANFAYAGEKINGEWHEVVDENNMPYVIYDPSVTNELYLEP